MTCGFSEGRKKMSALRCGNLDPHNEGKFYFDILSKDEQETIIKKWNNRWKGND